VQIPESQITRANDRTIRTYIQVGLRHVEQDGDAELLLGLLEVVEDLQRAPQQRPRLHAVGVLVQNGVGVLHHVLVLLYFEVRQGPPVLAAQLQFAGGVAVRLVADCLGEVCEQ
jgi:hypothetical protein